MKWNKTSIKTRTSELTFFEIASICLNANMKERRRWAHFDVCMPYLY